MGRGVLVDPRAAGLVVHTRGADVTNVRNASTQSLGCRTYLPQQAHQTSYLGIETTHSAVPIVANRDEDAIDVAIVNGLLDRSEVARIVPIKPQGLNFVLSK
tara:strand:- start:2753 stop:3058 length:306 start_codon:yes stop_codon:yes gene_type:complete